MIFLRINSVTKDVEFIHHMPFDVVNGMNKTESELLENGILVESIPEPQKIEGKSPVLKYNGTNLYYEYQDAVVDEMAALKNKIDLQEQALAELTMYISTLGV